MGYQVLARKWRPQDFSGVIGQAPVVKALQNAISGERIAHAYLFSGIRGVGKTSVARILAKGLNCEKGPAAEPCNDCPTCHEITAGGDFDVIEVDAATYSKVEQVRELTESLKYGPARDRFKVVILDEIHRLSRQAFDALLKIVEEPPDHLVFIFATTEVDAVPATILSRCQEFRFRRVPLDELSRYLEDLAGREEISVGPSALRLIARAGEGSVRDSVALLDQLATFGSGTIDDGDAARLLGGLDHGVFRLVLTAIGHGDSSAIVETANRIESEGWDPRFVFSEFLSYCRMALHLSLGSRPEALETTQEEADALAPLAKELGYEQILRALNLLLASEESVRRSESAGLALEVAWLRAAELPKLVSVEDLLAGSTPSSAGSGDTRAPSKPSSEARSGSRKKRVAPAPAPTTAPVPAPAASRPKAAPERPSPQPTGDIATFLSAVGRHRQALSAHLAGANGLEFRNQTLEISVPPGDKWLHDRLAKQANRTALEEALTSTWGDGCRWKLIEDKSPKEPTAPTSETPSETDSASAQALEDPRVQSVLEIFGGSIESVKEN